MCAQVMGVRRLQALLSFEQTSSQTLLFWVVSVKAVATLSSNHEFDILVHPSGGHSEQGVSSLYGQDTGGPIR